LSFLFPPTRASVFAFVHLTVRLSIRLAVCVCVCVCVCGSSSSSSSVLWEAELPEIFFLSSLPSWSSLWKQILKYRMSRLYTAGWNFPENVSMKCLLVDHTDLHNTATNDVTILNFSRYGILLSISHRITLAWYTGGTSSESQTGYRLLLICRYFPQSFRETA
jgi:hypothetical protein